MSLLHWKTFCWIFLFQTTFAGGIDNNNPSFPSSSSSISVSITIPMEENVSVNGRRQLYNIKEDNVWSYIFITSGNCDDVQGRESIDSREKCLAYVESIHSKGDGTRDTMHGTKLEVIDYPIGCFQGGTSWAFNSGGTSNGGGQTNEDCGDSFYDNSNYARPVENVLGCACRFQQAEINISPSQALDGIGGCTTNIQELTSGRCTNFLTAAECKALGDSSITSGSYDSEFTDETYPSGCYVQSNKYYYQQDLSTNTLDCTDWAVCQCKHLLEVGDTTTQPYTCDITKAQSYTIVTSGLPNARYNILTEDECKTYATVLGGSNVYIRADEWTSRPKGCYQRLAGIGSSPYSFYFNTYEGNDPSECTIDFPCTASHFSYSADNYIKKISGQCVTLRRKGKCAQYAASKALTFEIIDGATNVDQNWVPGCQKFGEKIYYNTDLSKATLCSSAIICICAPETSYCEGYITPASSAVDINTSVDCENILGVVNICTLVHRL